MTPPLVVCRCDPAWPAFAVCDVCAERAVLHRRLVAPAVVRAMSSHPSTEAWAALVSGGREWER